MIVDLKERQPVNMMPSGVMAGSMSWQRLVRILREAGEFSDNEEVTHVSSDLLGLHFRVEQKTS